MKYRKIFSVLLLMSVIAWPSVPSASSLAPETGHFLVARNDLHDPRFREAVILLIHHDSRGTGGVIVNRASRLPLEEVFADQPKLANLKGTLFYGGPVSPQAVFALAWTVEAAPKGAQAVMDEVYLTSPRELSEWLQGQKGQLGYRVFTGYAGWAPGQLAQEMARGDWLVLPAGAPDIFSEDIEQLWQRLKDTRVM